MALQPSFAPSDIRRTYDDRPPVEQGLASSNLSIDDALLVINERLPLRISSEVRELVRQSRAVVERALERGDVVYGLNTHLGFRRNEVVPTDDLWLYQDFVISTHAAGIGDSLTAQETRAVLLARIAGMARGGSGVSPAVFQLLVEMLNRNVLPLIPNTGSVGAADLTQLAAVAEVVAGRGQATVDGTRVSSLDALNAVGLKPATLGPKDALSIISANSVSVGLGVLAIDELRSA